MLDKLKEKLPNIPEEVLVSWLLPFAEADGLPSSPDNKWDEKKTGEVLSFWNDAQWEKIELDLTTAKFSRSHNRSIDSLLDAYVGGKNNLYFQHLGEDGRKRFSRCFLYLLRNGVFPVIPILTITHKNEYEVLDGNHRFAAHKSATQAYTEMQSLPSEQRDSMLEKLKIDSFNLPKSIQEVWVCRPNWNNSPRVGLQRYLLNNGIDAM